MANLLEKSSILITPTAYSDGKIHSAKPIQSLGGLDADLDFTRGSSATRVNADGLIESSQGINTPRINYKDGVGSLLLEGQSTNLITQSEAFGNAYWTKSGATIEGDASTAGAEKVVNGDFATDSDWTITNGGGGATSVIGSGYLRLVTDGTSTQAVQDIGMVVGKTYKLTYEILSTDGGYLAIIESNNTAKLIPSTIGTHTVYYQPNDQNFTFKRYSGALDVQIDNVSVKEVQGFSAPSVDSPASAFKLVEDTSTGSHLMFNSVTVASGESHTTSLYLKSDNVSWVRLFSDYGSFNRSTYYDLTNATIGTDDSADSTITSLSNGWYRITQTDTTDQTGFKVRLYLADGDNSSSYQGDGTSGVYIFGAQLEALSHPTSYISTSGTIQTRLAESASKSGLSSLINSTEGVLYAEVNYGQQISEWRGFGITDGSAVNRIIVFLKPNTNELQVYVSSQNVNRILGQYNISNLNMYHKIAIKYKLNDCSLWLDGVKIDTDNTVDMPIGLNELSLSSTPSVEFLYADLKVLQVYNTALTDEELTCLTKI